MSTKANHERKVDRGAKSGMGISAGQVGTQLRRSIFAESIKKKDYDINVRFNYEDRYNQSTLLIKTLHLEIWHRVERDSVSTVASQRILLVQLNIGI
jgi:hypothetical protein